MDGYGAATTECPACGWPAPAGTGARQVCTHCGCSWQVEPIEVPTDAAVLDALGAAALPLDRLRAFLHGPDGDR